MISHLCKYKYNSFVLTGGHYNSSAPSIYPYNLTVQDPTDTQIYLLNMKPYSSCCLVLTLQRCESKMHAENKSPL